jgi:hypothetical protein
MKIMYSRVSLLFAAVLLMAASPSQGPTPLAMAQPMLSPPSSFRPADVAPSFSPAPVPDVDQDGVGAPKTGPSRVVLTPSFYHQRDRTKGDGYTPNSTIYGEQTKRLRPAPGINLRVPLE